MTAALHVRQQLWLLLWRAYVCGAVQVGVVRAWWNRLREPLQLQLLEVLLQPSSTHRLMLWGLLLLQHKQERRLWRLWKQLLLVMRAGVQGPAGARALQCAVTPVLGSSSQGCSSRGPASRR